ncbi:MAG: Unknown protein [uncultured Sulfurovum sp.]|uniref:ATPase AAA-type core domain-containing protein n=1 Tax=uncultured Sulfurovum sp. TaxID=269237 RepID=A0A6S6S986_9BACT|nr:MAG: Unknown protein [uncultured Sulfurovum sp.]
MELVYLWVEEYKNIKEQGFNFSPRFECTYENNELTIVEKKEDEYIKDFFGTNINITAIVGRNGSGKSSLFELLIETIHTFFKDFLKEKEKFNDIFKKKKVFIIFYSKKNNELLIINSITKKKPLLKIFISLKYKDEISDLKSIEETLFFLHYDYSCTKFRPYENNKSVSSSNPYSLINEYTLYEKSSLFQLLPKKTGMNNDNILGNDNYDKLVIMEVLYSKNKFIDTIYFTPEEITLEKNLNSRDGRFKNLRESVSRSDNALSYMKMMVYAELINLVATYSNKELIDFLQKIPKEYDEHFINKKDYFLELFKRSPQYIDKVKLLYDYLECLDSRDKEVNQLFLFQGEDNKPMYLKVNKKHVDQNSIDFFTKMPSQLFDIQILDKGGKSYNDLSNGEKSALRIRSYIESILHNNEKQHFFILLDEPANDMHPEWQKKLLSYLVETFKNRTQTIHFIFTSHSPFIISDLPKENVIFLKDGKIDKGLHQQTFGANIHTLLSDSFFMEDGLMGEFAKGKITEIKKFYEKVIKEKKTDENIEFYDKHQKKFWQIQKIIGEPFLQRVIGNYLDELELIFSDDNTLIQKELDEIEERKNYLLKLKEESHNDRN